MLSSPIDLQGWIEENRFNLLPPVNNGIIHQGKDFFVMAISGPNVRTDYHINPYEEWFYQYKGDMLLKVVDMGSFKDIPIKEGGMFLLPANVPHNPVRFENTLGIVIERNREPHQKDKFRWYCQNNLCQSVVHEDEAHVSNIETQVKEIILKYHENESLRRCPKCGHLNSSL